MIFQMFLIYKKIRRGMFEMLEKLENIGLGAC